MKMLENWKIVRLIKELEEHKKTYGPLCNTDERLTSEQLTAVLDAIDALDHMLDVEAL